TRGDRAVNGGSPSGRSRNPCAVPSGAHRLSGVSRGRVDEGVANLDVCLREAQKSPADDGIVELIVRRPAADERELLDEATLALGSAVIEVTAKPHTGCFKFRDRFGAEALRIVNSPAGKVQRLRGVNARIVRAGTVRRGDRVRKLAAGSTER